MVDTVIRSIKNNTQYAFKLGVGNIVLQPGVVVDLFKIVSDDLVISLQGELEGLAERNSISVLSRVSKDTVTLANDQQARVDILDLENDVSDLKTSISQDQSDISVLKDDVDNLEDIKAQKKSVISTSDLSAVSQADASVQTGSYIQADVQSIADLSNKLKEDLDIATTVINELKTKINEMNIS